jgi:pimeloyl-ACP methyl ester carboxylesterase
MNPQASSQADTAFQLLASAQIARGTAATFVKADQGGGARRPAGTAVKRGTRASQAGEPTAQVMLVEDSRGVLRWDYRAGTVDAARNGAPSLRRSAFGGRSRYRGGIFGGRLIASADVAEVGPNAIGIALEKLDRELTPQQGLRLLNGASLGAPVKPDGQLKNATRLLLLVHGTFSKGDMYFEQLPGAFFASALAQRYSHVASFDHPTLSVSPILNAMDLENALRKAGLPSETPVDIVCHSRGGLVASWWIRSTRCKVEKLVAVGAPLSGTSLASPYRIRHLLDYFANYARALSGGLNASAAFPSFASGFLAGAGGLMGILGGVSSALSALPVADAAVALVPGLHGQSRVTNNAELDRLWGDPRWSTAGANPDCYVVKSDFEAKRDAPWWNILGQLRQLPWLAADGVTDRLFPSSNDLVVDTESMSHKLILPTDSLSFDRKAGIHHCAYFAQAATVSKLHTWLQIP